MVGMWVGERRNLEPIPDLLSPWPDVTFGIFATRLTIAVNYKMALCDSFTGIKAFSRFLTG